MRSLDKPPDDLAVILRHGNSLIITGATPATQAAGVVAGMTSTEARALLPKLETVFQNDDAEADALNLLAEFVYGLLPTVHVLRPNLLVMDTTGSTRLHGGEDVLIRKLADGCARLGYSACIAAADNASVAITLALAGKSGPTAPERQETALKDVPLGALRLGQRTIEQFAELGIHTVGALMKLPLDSLPHRFDDALVERMRQLRGESTETFEHWKPKQQPRERLDFAGPTNSYSSLLFVLRKAATFMATRLAVMASGARQLEARFICTDGEDLEFSLDTARPTADQEGLAALLLARFEKIGVDDRWFEAFELTVPSHEVVPDHQKQLFEAEDASRGGDLLRLLDELTGRLGKEAVSRAVLTPDPNPRRSFEYVPYRERGRSQSSPRPGRPVFLDRNRYVVREASRTSLPACWDFRQNNTGLRVIAGPERVVAKEAADYFTVETASGEWHWISFSSGKWWVPRELGDETAALRSLTECARDESDGSPINYAELVCASNFSFLRGASTAEQLFAEAARRGLRALAITDWHTLAGIVRAHSQAKEQNVRLIVGSRLALVDGPDICLYAMHLGGYKNLCRLLTLGKRRTTKGQCELFLRDLPEFADGLQCVALRADAAPLGALAALKNIYGRRLSLGVSRHYEAFGDACIAEVLDRADGLCIPGVAVNDVHWHTRETKLLQDTLACIRQGQCLHESSDIKFQNEERRLKSGAEMAGLWLDRPDLIARSTEIADSCRFSLDELRYQYPSEMAPSGISMQAYLEQETWKGAEKRYPNGVPESVIKQLRHELKLIDELEYAPYFLTVYDIVRFAVEKNILHQGRGSAANSSVCFCLGVTAVDPTKTDLLFERFISRERNEPPDIDIDFEHERREEVIQYIYRKYGRERTGICATVISYRLRSAIRDVGKAVGLSLDQVNRLSKTIQWWDDKDKLPDVLRESGFDVDSPLVQATLSLSGQLQGYPRHLSQHVGGFVITEGRLDELVPIENAAMEDRTVLEWDKDDIDELGILKVDCLSLGMLTAIRKCFDLIAGAGGHRLSVPDVFACDPTARGETPQARAIYGMLHKADAVGTFQVESRAQMSMLPRLKPKEFYDLVIEVAIVRPGPIQGGMVHPYLRRRSGEDTDWVYPHPDLERVLARTYGVPLFQEQAMQIAVVAAGFTPGEADQLRKAMGGWRRPGLIENYRRKLMEGMKAKGIDDEFAERLYQQIAGFGEYGFPESHAASFAMITFVSCFLKRFYPTAFTAALINSQPMGFYGVSSLVRDAREHGVRALPVDINASAWNCTLEGDGEYAPAALDTAQETWGMQGPALRLGMRLVRGLGQDLANAVSDARGSKPFVSVSDVYRRVAGRVTRRALLEGLARLAAADAFASLDVGRQHALWQVRGLSREVPKLFADLDRPDEADLPGINEQDHVTLDYRTAHLSLRAHPVSFMRERLESEGVVPAAALREKATGDEVEVAGYAIGRQRPGTAGGVTFVTLEDETAIANLVVYSDFMEANRKVLIGSRYLAASGIVERHGDVIHLKVDGVRSLDATLPDIKQKSRNFH